MNNTTDSVQEFNFNANKFKIKSIVVFTVVTLVTYFGNTLILISLRRFSKRLKGTPYILIGNLAVADLLLATGLTFQLIEYIFTSLETNTYFCVVKVCLLAVSLMASGMLLLFISVDRFCAIVFPMKHLLRSAKRKRRTAKVVLVWAVSLLVGCIPTFVQASSSQVDMACRFGELTPRTITLVAAVFIPLQFVVSVVLCLIVIWRLRTNTMSRNKYKKSMVKCRLLIKIYVVFAVCWAPFVVTTILIETSSQKAKYMTIREYAVIPGLFNSAMNWIIYGLANNKLRQAFKDILLCRSQRDINASNYIQSVSSDSKKNGTSSGQQFVEPYAVCETSA